MAGDWMKIELNTPDKPEVVAMAARLRLDQDEILGKLFRIWAWADRNSVDGVGMFITRDFLDRLTRKRGFANAMESVGWLSEEDGMLTFPGFERHNGKSAKARAESNRRMTKTRELRKCCNESATKSATPPQQKAQPEKRREEKSIKTLSIKARGTLGDVVSFAEELGMPASDGESCWHKWEGNGWKNGANQIKDWKATVRSWKAAGYLPSQKITTFPKNTRDRTGEYPQEKLELP
jgi:hypothetical protein